MKYLILLLAILAFIPSNAQKEMYFSRSIRDSLNKLKVSSDFKPTKYKPGFKYINNQGEKATLIKYVKTNINAFGVDNYRWRVKVEKYGVSAIVWTDDCWIDLSTGKAYLDNNTHRIIYYK